MKEGLMKVVGFFGGLLVLWIMWLLLVWAWDHKGILFMIFIATAVGGLLLGALGNKKDVVIEDGLQSTSPVSTEGEFTSEDIDVIDVVPTSTVIDEPTANK